MGSLGQSRRPVSSQHLMHIRLSHMGLAALPQGHLPFAMLELALGPC